MNASRPETARDPRGHPAETAAKGEADRKEQPDKQRPLWVHVLRRSFVYFSIYAISLGPMYWRWWEGKYLNGSKFIAAFYEPLFLVSGWIPPLGWFLNSYVHIWVIDLKWTI
jgi:hypothetical protein